MRFMTIDLHSPQELRDALHESEQEVARLEAVLETIFEAAKHPSDNALYNTVKHIERERKTA